MNLPFSDFEAIQQLREQFSHILVSGSDNSSNVVVTISAVGKISSLQIDPSLLHPSEKEVLQNSIIAAFNNASGKLQEEMLKSLQNKA